MLLRSMLRAGYYINVEDRMIAFPWKRIRSLWGLLTDVIWKERTEVFKEG